MQDCTQTESDRPDNDGRDFPTSRLSDVLTCKPLDFAGVEVAELSIKDTPYLSSGGRLIDEAISDTSRLLKYQRRCRAQAIVKPVGPIRENLLHKLEPEIRDYDIRNRSLIDEFAFVAAGEVKLCAMFKSN